jgi:predicted metal-dependent enzyme (double-stranded beta helix superfamily)
MKTRQLVTADQQLGNLVGAVRAATRHRPGWPATVELVADRLRLHLPSPDILTAEQRYGDPLTYQCQVLHAESDGSFSIVALVWRPGQATPIHDHVTWCDFGELQGSEREDRFTLRSDGWLEAAGTSVSQVGDVTGLVPPGDIHRVRNDGPQTAISLHIYGTDVSRLGTSVRRTYDWPVVACSPVAANPGSS